MDQRINRLPLTPERLRRVLQTLQRHTHGGAGGGGYGEGTLHKLLFSYAASFKNHFFSEPPDAIPAEFTVGYPYTIPSGIVSPGGLLRIKGWGRSRNYDGLSHQIQLVVDGVVVARANLGSSTGDVRHVWNLEGQAVREWDKGEFTGQANPYAMVPDITVSEELPTTADRRKELPTRTLMHAGVNMNLDGTIPVELQVKTDESATPPVSVDIDVWIDGFYIEYVRPGDWPNPLAAETAPLGTTCPATVTSCPINLYVRYTNPGGDDGDTVWPPWEIEIWFKRFPVGSPPSDVDPEDWGTSDANAWWATTGPGTTRFNEAWNITCSGGYWEIAWIDAANTDSAPFRFRSKRQGLACPPLGAHNWDNLTVTKPPGANGPPVLGTLAYFDDTPEPP